MFFRCIILTSVFLLKSQGIFFELDSVCDREELRMRWAYLLVELYMERFFCFVLFCFVLFFFLGGGGGGVPSGLIRDNPRKKSRSNKTPTLSKSMNMNVCEVGTSNQLGS